MPAGFPAARTSARSRPKHSVLSPAAEDPSILAARHDNLARLQATASPEPERLDSAPQPAVPSKRKRSAFTPDLDERKSILDMHYDNMRSSSSRDASTSVVRQASPAYAAPEESAATFSASGFPEPKEGQSKYRYFDQIFGANEKRENKWSHEEMAQQAGISVLDAEATLAFRARRSASVVRQAPRAYAAPEESAATFSVSGFPKRTAKQSNYLYFEKILDANETRENKWSPEEMVQQAGISVLDAEATLALRARRKKT